MKLMPHNERAVNEIMNHFNMGIQSIIYTAGVGVGKSFVFMGVAEKIKGRILYILPKHAISENVKAYKEFYMFADRTDFVTFNYFSDECKYNKLENYSLIVVDEAHHIGSDLYGRHLLEAIKKHSCKVLGLTATPIRMKGTVKDVTKLFDCCVRGLSNFEAITQGLMPQIEYLVCTPDENVEISNDEVMVIDLNESYELLNEAIQTNPKDKWICFFSNISELHKTKPLIKKLFPDHKVLEIHSRRKNCAETLRKANEVYDKCVMLNCDMLLEGLHFSGVNGIIIFRNVHSIPVFEQIIGRVSSIGKKENPLVIDCTDTWQRMDNFIESPEEHTVIEIGNGNGTVIKKKPCFVSLKNKKYYDYMKHLEEQFYQHSKSIIYNGKEYSSLIDCCRDYNIKASTFNSIKMRNPKLSDIEVMNEAITRKQENVFLFRNVNYKSFAEACREYNLTYDTVKRTAQRRNITYQDAMELYLNDEIHAHCVWSDEEKELMNKYYPTEGTFVYKRLNGKNRKQCKAFAVKNKIKFAL